MSVFFHSLFSSLMFLGWPGWVFLASLLYQSLCSTTCGQPVRSSDHSQQIWLQQTRSVWISGSMVLILILIKCFILFTYPAFERNSLILMNWEATMSGFSLLLLQYNWPAHAYRYILPCFIILKWIYLLTGQ